MGRLISFKVSLYIGHNCHLRKVFDVGVMYMTEDKALEYVAEYNRVVGHNMRDDMTFTPRDDTTPYMMIDYYE